MATVQTSLQALSGEIRTLTAQVARATVSIRGPRQRPTTGTIVGADRVIAILHVIGRDAVTVHTDDGREIEGKVVGRDDTRDLALIEAPGLAGSPLPAAEADVQVGDIVLAVSRNWHGRPAASLGVVGAVGGPVSIGRHFALERIIRADVTSTRGLSGSPLVNAAGELVGILNAGLSRGVPLAVPIAEVERSVSALAEHGRIRRGYLGIGLQPVAVPQRQHAAGSGLLIVSVEASSPADQAQLFVGDIILRAGGQAVEDFDDLQEWLKGDRIGTPMALEILRGDRVLTIDVTVGERTPRA
ncbi:MAG TPA: trypsin-like peptidase domain-containing protein [Vicinamibacterales bacterium]